MLTTLYSCFQKSTDILVRLIDGSKLAIGVDVNTC